MAVSRRDFITMLSGVVAASFAHATPIIGTARGCTFCGHHYPQARWIVESPDGERAMCDTCAEKLESILQELDNGNTDRAAALLEHGFAGQFRAEPADPGGHFLMM